MAGEKDDLSQNDSDDKLQCLLNERDVIVAKLTRFADFVSQFHETNIFELETRLEHVPTIAHQFDIIQGQIESLNPDELKQANRETFENSYYKSLACGRNHLVQFHAKLNPRPQANNTIGSQNKFSLPPIELPKFEGDYKKWLFFIQRFTALVDQNLQLSNVEKFYYLQGRLQGEALEVIQDLALTEHNYPIALNLLIDRYENKRVIVDRHVDDLFNIPEVVNESSTQLRRLIDSFKQHVRSLKALGEPTESWDRLLIHLIKSKLDKNTRDRWQEISHSKTKQLPPTLREMLDFLVCRCEYLESLDKGKPVKQVQSVKHPPSRSTKFSLSAINKTPPNTQDSKPITCFFCQQSHAIYNCTSFINLTVDDKYREIKRLGLCTNCLRKGHSQFHCTSGSCRLCNRKHNSLLHPQSQSQNTAPANSNQNTPSSSTRPEQPLPPQNACTLISGHSLNNNLVLLSTAIIFIKDIHGHSHKARALLDVGSQSNYLTMSLVDKLQLNKQNVNVSISGVGKNTLSVFNQTSARIKSMHSDFEVELSFLILPKITDQIPNSHFNVEHLNIPHSISLADPSLDKPGEIDILLGASHFYELLETNQISLGQGKPLLQSTKLGWILAGVVHCPLNAKPRKAVCALTLNQQLTKFWEIEETPVKRHLSFEETFCETFFNETTTRDSEGRFVIKLPFNELINQLGNSKPAALKRLTSIEKRFDRDAEYKQLYVNFINEYLTLNHMSSVGFDINNETFAFYLPHHGVKKESSTTKLRVVYDGSAVTDSNVSLNHCLGVGPQIQDDLFNIIIRFRSHSYILTADIEKMYRMVVVHPDHRRFQRIFWREHKDQPIQIFELSRLAYGLSSAPYLATRCLQELANQNMSSYPDSCRVILRDFFVDDLITGADSLEEIIRLKQEISSILHSGGFELRKWGSNHPDVLSDIGSSHQAFYEKSDCKTLGLVWDSKRDALQYSVDFQAFKNIHVTKRQILSTISKIFDPLGLVGPTTIKAKILMQKLWQCQSSWDAPVPLHLLDQWKTFVEKIHLINDLVIPRDVLCLSPDRIEIHGFCDSSEAAYGCCIYLRSYNSTNCTVRLLCAKSRVAPLKRITLPRLELCGALLLCRLLKVIQSAFIKKIDQVFLYTDSKIVLAWISTQPCYLQTFVANRVSEIVDATSISDWYHVGSADNPADVISRGTNPEQLYSNEQWWNGPPFLQESSSQFISHNIDLSNIDIPDLKISSTILVTQTITDFSIFNRFSSFLRLLRVTAYILRFKNNCLKRTILRGSLLCKEINSARVTLIKLTQLQEFSTEITALSQNKPLPNSSKLLNLNPFLDDKQLLRVGGRIQNSDTCFNQKHPIILPQKHLFTELLISHEHLNHLHAGAQLLLAVIRLQFWPLCGKSAVKRILRKCVRCFRATPIPLNQLMGNLPADRFATVKPFHKTAVDYAGPFLLKTSYLRNAKVVKAYVCVFVCMATRATHIELVSNLSTDAFLMALKRFVSRRGKPADIHSDNGTNFVGCHNELKELHSLLKNQQHLANVTDFLSNDNIRWHFIPANSPHMGGLWEGAVKAVKYHLKRVISNDKLTFDEMYTLLVQIEACLNSRPITPLSSDPSDLYPLTPAHFLIGDSLLAVPERGVMDVQQNRLTRVNRLNQIHQHFWRRWSQEYLSQLQVRSKWRVLHTNALRVGSMVVLKEDNLPPLKWCLGRVVELFPGGDGITRVVSVRVASGAIFKRAIAKVCLLPIDDEDEEL